MKALSNTLLTVSLLLGATLAPTAFAQTDSIQGTYRAVLKHEAQEEDQPQYHQFATITLRTVNTGGNLKISASVRMVFGDWNSNEFLTYEYPEVPMNLLTRQVSIRTDDNDVSFIGTLRNGSITGEWFSSSVGRVGTFEAKKGEVPEVEEDSLLVKTVTGHYRGILVNTHPESNLPERMSMSLVTTQTPTDSGVVELKISGNLRFYLGDFGSGEFVETSITEAQFNFYNRYLTIKTAEYGITLKGILNPSGNYVADVFADGLGRVGTVELETMQ
jgi:hypothetical protein